jgi:hypothetical protein
VKFVEQMTVRDLDRMVARAAPTAAKLHAGLSEPGADDSAVMA